MGKDKTKTTSWKYIIYAIIAIGLLTSYSLYMVNNTPKQTKVKPIKSFSVVSGSSKAFVTSGNTESSVKTFVVTPFVTSDSVTNPTDPYSPMPLRVSTVGAGIYHRPFCKYAKQALITHGLPKRTNYFTREQVADSGRTADTYCIAGAFDCSEVTPAEFSASGNDPWCGANIRLARYNAFDDVTLADKFLCNLNGFIGTFVDNPAHCTDGKVQSSDTTCDQAACAICTVDCEVVCAGCVRVTQSVFNELALGMGDATKDAQADINDYPYFHECFSGPIAATIPCQNVFDYDKDADVDETDFDLFAASSYNTGNVSWAIANFPTAVVNAPKPKRPLRVGIEGSKYYHRQDCPSANASWAKWGIDRKEIFSTWGQVEASGRIPDTNASKCLAGTRNDPTGKCSLDDDGDGILNCDDNCPQDPNKTEPGLCGCGVSDVDTDNNGTPDCNDPVVILYENTFDTAGETTGWFDTGASDESSVANNSLVEVPEVFSIVDQGTFVALAHNASSFLINPHSHHIGSSTWTGYKYSGKMMATESPDIGVTFFSDYPNSDTYYRLRSRASSSFQIIPRGTAVTGNIDTGIVPVIDIWYNFSIWVRNTTANGTEISAKVWAEGDAEPSWQVTCNDNSATRRTQGSFGVYSGRTVARPVERYWDDIKVTNY